MAIKTLLSARQVFAYMNKRRGGVTPTAVMTRMEELVEEGIVEFVPYSNFHEFTFRDNSAGVYLHYQRIDFPERDVRETLTAAVPKAREIGVDLASYVGEFRKKHLTNLG